MGGAFYIVPSKALGHMEAFAGENSEGLIDDMGNKNSGCFNNFILMW